MPLALLLPVLLLDLQVLLANLPRAERLLVTRPKHRTVRQLCHAKTNMLTEPVPVYTDG